MLVMALIYCVAKTKKTIRTSSVFCHIIFSSGSMCLVVVESTQNFKDRMIIELTLKVNLKL